MYYSKVKFISWNLDTAPIDMGEHSCYLGLWNPYVDSRFDVLSQIRDIEARFFFFKEILANSYNYFDHSENVLNIFIAPEFLFRGPAGAYLSNLLSGWENVPTDYNLQNTCFEKWDGLFGLLNKELSQEKYKHCLFVMGTAVGASYTTQSGRIVSTQNTEAYNYSFVKLGGSSSEKSLHYCKKNFKSNIDFLRFTTYLSHIDNNIEYVGDEFYNINGVDGAVFSFDEIKKPNGDNISFGLEICLDHIGVNNNGQYEGIIKNSGQRVDIQLVPSCGMWLHEESLALNPGYSYAINCDGIRMSSDICCPQGYVNRSVVIQNPQLIKVGNIDVHSATLWNNGSGNLCVYNTLPLTN